RVSDRRPATMWSLGLGLSPLELPRREAPDVDVELVQAGVVAVALELNPKLQFFPRYGQVANRAQVSDPRAAPCTVGTTGRVGRLGALQNLIGESGGPPTPNRATWAHRPGGRQRPRSLCGRTWMAAECFARSSRSASGS